MTAKELIEELKNRIWGRDTKADDEKLEQLSQLLKKERAARKPVKQR